MPMPGTITCFLCGGTHIYPGPRYEAHLQNEHGAIFDLDFLISVSLHKQNYASMPVIADTAATPPRSVGGPEEEQGRNTLGLDMASQTAELVCSRCNDPLGEEEEDRMLAREEIKGEMMDGSEDEEDDLDSSRDLDLPRHFLSVSPRGAGDSGQLVSCWLCPICPMIYKRHSYFKQHMCIAHEVAAEDVSSMTSVDLTEEEFQKRQQEAVRDNKEQSGMLEGQEMQTGLPGNCYAVDKAKRKVVGKEWAPNSFSSRFTCLFCNEQFRKDYKLKLHLMMIHKDQPPDIMEKAKEELIKAKLDGCVHKCGLCGNKYNSIANFTRHIKDVHSMSRNQYKQEYGDSEVVSRMFTCELCNKEVKHTRNIIGAHMKMVHLVSWKEYQDIILKLKSGEGSIDMPTPELFDCIICGVSVKYKREHLNKKHQLDEDVYEELIAKKNRGEDISADLPDREVFTCNICERECMDFKRHLLVCHKLSEDQYVSEFCDGLPPKVKIIKQGVFNEGGEGHLDISVNGEGGLGTASPHFTPSTRVGGPIAGGSGGKKKKLKKEKGVEQEPLSTDLQCYFECEEVFKKDYQLHLHLKLRHRNEDPAQLERAYEAANEEIALTRRSASLFNCALCPRTFNDNGAFYGHIQNKHEISYRDYKEQYGRCETECQQFECMICGKVIKHDRNTVHTHLKNVHGINWTKYLDRVRRVRRGLDPEPLPTMKMTECRVCNVSVKYLKEHLKNAHKITEKEYEELFSDDNDCVSDRKKTTSMFETTTPPPKRSRAEGVVSEDNISVVSFPASNNSDNDYMDHLDGAPPLITPKLEPLVEVDLKVERPPKADIQNKGNKTCSVCKIAFDARKTFIEHCQLSHGMKFKTKSGMSIPPPPLSSTTVKKRKVEEDMEKDGNC